MSWPTPCFLYVWNDILRYDELPKVKNPASGWLQNANDPPWTCTFPRVLNPEQYPPYLAPVYMALRPQRAARMLAEDESITFDELVMAPAAMTSAFSA